MNPSDHVIDFIHEYCCQKNGKPIRLLPWQLDFIRKLYDTRNENGLRQYRQAFVFLPRRNGKSTFFACLLIYELVNGDNAGEIYIVANTITQSNDAVFDACRSIAENSPALRKRLKVLKTRSKIENRKTRSRLAVLSSTQNALLGKDASVLCFDEIAFFKDRRLYSNLKGSQLNRKQPLNISITTASDNLEGVGKELYDYAVGVRDGMIQDDTFLPVIYEATADQDWRDPATWKQANPSLGTLFQESDLEKLANEAAQCPRKQSEFFQFHLNRWQHSALCWLTKEMWEGCAAEFTEDQFIGKTCYTGIDLAKKHDMAAVVHVFPIDGDYYLLPRFFLPKANIQAKELADHAPLQLWSQQGFLTLTDGDVIDYAVIRDVIKADAQKFKMQEMGYDPWSGELLCNQQLRMEDGINAVEVRQRIDVMAPTCIQFVRLLMEKRIKHNRNPVLSWHAASVSVRTDANGNFTTDKKHSKARFDGIQAALIGLSRCLTLDMGPCLITW